MYVGAKRRECARRHELHLIACDQPRRLARFVACFESRAARDPRLQLFARRRARREAVQHRAATFGTDCRRSVTTQQLDQHRIFPDACDLTERITAAREDLVDGHATREHQVENHAWIFGSIRRESSDRPSCSASLPP